MNLDKLFAWVVGVVIAFAATGQLDVLLVWVWRTQAKIIYQSRISTWGSPRFFIHSGHVNTSVLNLKNMVNDKIPVRH